MLARDLGLEVLAHGYCPDDIEGKGDTELVETEVLASPGVAVQVIQEKPGLVQDNGQDSEEMLRRKTRVELPPLCLPVVALRGEDGVLAGQVPYITKCGRLGGARSPPCGGLGDLVSDLMVADDQHGIVERPKVDEKNWRASNTGEVVSYHVVEMTPPVWCVLKQLAHEPQVAPHEGGLLGLRDVSVLLESLVPPFSDGSDAVGHEKGERCPQDRPVLV